MENGRIAALVPGSLKYLAPKIARHGADEDKHGREHAETDIITYLAHSRVTEQRASEQIRALRKYAGHRPDIGRAVTMISNDEDNHLAYCHEELLRLAAAGHAVFIRRTLRAAARAEIVIHRDVIKAVMARMGLMLGRPRPKSAALAAGVHAVYLCEGSAAGGGWYRCGLRPDRARWAARHRLSPPARSSRLAGTGAAITRLRRGERATIAGDLVYLALAALVVAGRFGPWSFTGH